MLIYILILINIQISALIIFKIYKQMLKVATLNFSGINFSPFQFYDGGQQKVKLSEIFREKIFKYYPNRTKKDFNWKSAKLDKLFKKQRYSILYRNNIGIVKNRLLTKDQFYLIWDYEMGKNQTKIQQNQMPEDLLNQLRTFDWIAYESLLNYTYNVDIQKIDTSSVSKYKCQLFNWHNKEYLRLDSKMQKVIQYLKSNDIDILFLQQCGTNQWNNHLPKDYFSKQNHDSLIIYKKAIFKDKQQDLDFNRLYEQQLNFNKDSVFIKIGKYLLCSVHLTSKKQNVKQAKEMFNTLNKILEEYTDLVLIIGTDANHFISSTDDQKLQYSIYPQDSQSITTSKIRTYMQFQYNKSNKEVKQTKDHIITNMELQDGRIETIQNLSIKDSLIPSSNHPFDHFLVRANIKLKPKLQQKKSSIVDYLKIDRDEQDKQQKSQIIFDAQCNEKFVQMMIMSILKCPQFIISASNIIGQEKYIYENIIPKDLPQPNENNLNNRSLQDRKNIIRQKYQNLNTMKDIENLKGQLESCFDQIRQYIAKIQKDKQYIDELNQLNQELLQENRLLQQQMKKMQNKYKSQEQVVIQLKQQHKMNVMKIEKYKKLLQKSDDRKPQNQIQTKNYDSFQEQIQKQAASSLNKQYLNSNINFDSCNELLGSNEIPKQNQNHENIVNKQFKIQHNEQNIK